MFSYQSLSGGFVNELRVFSLVTDNNMDDAVVVRIYSHRGDQPCELDAAEHEIIGIQVKFFPKVKLTKCYDFSTAEKHYDMGTFSAYITMTSLWVVR